MNEKPVRAKGESRFRPSERFTRADYRRIFDEGASFPSRCMVLWTAKGGGKDFPSKLGVVVSKKTFPLAVERNRAKRLMREAFRLAKGRIARGGEVLLVGRRALVSGAVGLDDAIRDLNKLLKKAGLLNEEEKQIL